MITKEVKDKMAALKVQSVARIAGLRATLAERRAAGKTRRDAMRLAVTEDAKIENIDKEIATLQARKADLVSKKEAKGDSSPVEAEGVIE